jgi:hypothetical protein
MILVCLPAVGFRNEFVSRDPEHGVEHALIVNATTAKLRLDHGESLAGVRIVIRNF